MLSGRASDAVDLYSAALVAPYGLKRLLPSLLYRIAIIEKYMCLVTCESFENRSKRLLALHRFNILPSRISFYSNRAAAFIKRSYFGDLHVALGNLEIVFFFEKIAQLIAIVHCNWILCTKMHFFVKYM